MQVQAFRGMSAVNPQPSARPQKPSVPAPVQFGTSIDPWGMARYQLETLMKQKNIRLVSSGITQEGIQLQVKPQDEYRAKLALMAFTMSEHSLKSRIQKQLLGMLAHKAAQPLAKPMFSKLTSRLLPSKFDYQGYPVILAVSNEEFKAL